MEIKRDGYIFRVPDHPTAKYEVLAGGTRKHVAYFGDRRYQHYKDRLGFWSRLDHLDSDRRARYWARHSGIRLADGRLAVLVKGTPAWFSMHYLW
jgi:hypothetical protein